MNDDPRIRRLRELYDLAVQSGDPQNVERVRQAMRAEIPRYVRRQELREEYPSFVGRATVAAGKEMTDFARGATTLARRLASPITGEDPNIVREQAAAEQVQADREFEPMRQIDRTAAIVGSAVPYLAAPARTIPGMAAEGAAIGAAQAGTEPTADVAASALTGAILDPLAASTVNALTGVARGGGRPGPYAESIFRRGQELGFQVPASKVTGNENIAAVEAGLESSYMTGGHLARLKENNQQQINRIAAESIGEAPTAEFTPGTLNAAHENLGARYESLLEGRVFRDVVPAMRDAMAEIMEEARTNAERWIPRDYAEDIYNNVMEGLNAIEARGGTLTGRSFNNISSHLGSEARKAFRQEGGYDRGFMISAIKDALDRAVINEAIRADTLQGRPAAFIGQDFENLADMVRQGTDNLEFANELNDLRTRWKNLTMLEAPNVVKDTRVMPVTLANVLNRKDETGFKRGNNQSPLYDAARFATMNPTQFGSSGTAERTSVAREAGMIGQAAGTGAAMFGASGSPTLTGLTMALPWAYRQGLNATNALQTYLGNVAPGVLQTGLFGLGDTRMIDPLQTALRQSAKAAVLQREEPPEEFVQGLLGRY